MKKKNHGFTLAELLVVVAIVGILVAISIPIFTAQRKKAIMAVNKANIRSAKAAAAAKLYESPDTMQSYLSQEREQYLYYVYNVKTDQIELELKGNNVKFKDPTMKDYKGNIVTTGEQTVNNWGKVYRAYVENGKICPKILVYVGNPDGDAGPNGKNSAPIQTAPFFEGDKVGGTSNNPFGPAPGYK